MIKKTKKLGKNKNWTTIIGLADPVSIQKGRSHPLWSKKHKVQLSVIQYARAQSRSWSNATILHGSFLENTQLSYRRDSADQRTLVITPFKIVNFW